jgi:hypothetical protein
MRFVKNGIRFFDNFHEDIGFKTILPEHLFPGILYLMITFEKWKIGYVEGYHDIQHEAIHLGFIVVTWGTGYSDSEKLIKRIVKWNSEKTLLSYLRNPETYLRTQTLQKNIPIYRPKIVKKYLELFV